MIALEKRKNCLHTETQLTTTLIVLVDTHITFARNVDDTFRIDIDSFPRRFNLQQHRNIIFYDMSILE
jgi:hypothetical protein